jgi:hypothetical protein
MTGELTTEELARWWRETGEHELRQILLWRWDPLGLADRFPNTADEYDDYAPGLVQVLRDGGGRDEVAAYLRGIEEGPIGFPPSSPEGLRELGGMIAVWFENSRDSWARFGPVRR